MSGPSTSGYGQDPGEEAFPPADRSGAPAGGFGQAGHWETPAESSMSSFGPAEPPEPVRRAVTLMFIRAIIGALSLVVTLTSLGSLKNTLRKDHPNFSQSEIDATVNTAIAVAVVVGLVFLILYVFLAFKLREGKSWSRVVTFVLTGFGIVFGVLGLTGTATGLTKGVGVINALIDISIVVFLVKGGEYFVKRSPV